VKRNRAGNKGSRERGQALIVAVLAMGVLIGLVALTVDVGMLFHSRRHSQNTADAMALAGVAELPANPGLAKQKAKDWGANNGVPSSDIKTIEVRSTSYPNDTLYVQLEGQFDWLFGRVLGMTNSKVGAEAAARIGTLAGSHNMMPWGLLRGDTNCLDATTGNAIFGATCQVKIGAYDGIGGWRGALDYDGKGGGGSEYRANIIDGTVDTLYCIQGDPAPGCVTSVNIIDALDGNKVGPTGAGIDARWATGAKCDRNSNGKDDFNEVFTATGQTSPAYSVSCPDSPWLIIIPIITYEHVPIQTVTIRGWSLAYLQSFNCVDGSDCPGGKGHWEVSIQIAEAAYSQAAGFLGNYDPNSGVRVRRLIQ
jgi:hypothetical protein